MPVHLFRLAALALSAAALANCTARDAAYNPSHMRWHGLLAPPDIVLRPGSTPGLNAGGLYIENAAENSSSICCWIAPHAALEVQKGGRAASLFIGAWLPDNDRFRTHHQELRVGFPGYGRPHSVSLHPGSNVVHVAVPAQLVSRTGRLRVTLDTKYDLQAGPVTHGALRYGVLISSLYFE